MTILRRKQPYRIPPLHSRWTHRRRELPKPAPPPPPPPPDYVVTGTLTPDATGEYFHDGEHNDHPLYRRADSAFWIYWCSLAHWWRIADHVDAITDKWMKIGSGITGPYLPYGAVTGTATVSAA